MKYNNRGTYNSPITEITSNGISRKRDNEDDDFLKNVVEGGTGGGSGVNKDGNENKDEKDDPTKQAEATEAARLKAVEDAANGNKGGNDNDDNAGDNTGGDSNTPNGVTVDGVEYTLDKDGNALDKDNKVIYTPDQLKAFESNDDNEEDDEVIGSVIKSFGVEIKNEAGEVVKYEDTVDGIVKYVEDLVPVLVQEGANKFLETNPKVKAYYQHLALGKDDASFFNAVKEDWKQIKFDDKNPVQHKEIIKKYLITNGMEEDEAASTADTLNETGKASEAAKKYLDKLVAKQEQSQIQIDADYNARVKQAETDRINYWNTVEDLVMKKGQLSDFVIPASERAKFYEYLAKPTASGKTQDQIDQETDPLDKELQLSFLRFKNFNLDQLVKRTQETRKVKTLSSTLKKGKNRMGGGNSGGSNTKSANVEVSLETIYNT